MLDFKFSYWNMFVPVKTSGETGFHAHPMIYIHPAGASAGRLGWQPAHVHFAGVTPMTGGNIPAVYRLKKFIGPAVSGGYRLALENRADDKLIKIVCSRNAERLVSLRAPPVLCKLENRFFLLNYDSLINSMLFSRIRRGDFVGYACIRGWDDIRREDHVRLSSSQYWQDRQDRLFLVRCHVRKYCPMQCEWQACCSPSMDEHLATTICQDVLGWRGSIGVGQDIRVWPTAYQI